MPSSLPCPLKKKMTRSRDVEVDFKRWETNIKS